MECIHRHIALMRWELHELRSGELRPGKRTETEELEKDLVHRASQMFGDQQVPAPPGYPEIIRSACAADGLALPPDDAERLWRAASEVAHDNRPTIESRHVAPVEIVGAAHDMTHAGMLRFLDYSGTDVAEAIEKARDWVGKVIRLKEGMSRDEPR